LPWTASMVMMAEDAGEPIASAAPSGHSRPAKRRGRSVFPDTHAE
jgi:hypothetical protein